MVVVYSRDKNGKRTAARITKEIILDFIKNGPLEGEANKYINETLFTQIKLMNIQSFGWYDRDYQVNEIYDGLLAYVGRRRSKDQMKVSL